MQLKFGSLFNHVSNSEGKFFIFELIAEPFFSIVSYIKVSKKTSVG